MGSWWETCSSFTNLPTAPKKSMTSSERTLILGLGNPILSDDAVGLRVVDALQPLLSSHPHIDLEHDYWGGLRLMEDMIGYDRAIIIDAICSDAPPGTIQLLHPNGIDTQRSASAHDVNLSTALEVGRRAGARLPSEDRILLVAIEAEDVLTFGEKMTPQVEAAVPTAVQMVLHAIDT